MKKPVCQPVLLSAVLAILLNGCTGAKVSENSKTPPETRNVRTSADVVKLNYSGVALPAGAAVELPVPISIAPGYHVNANPATFAYLIATEVTADKSEGLTFGKPIYPTAAKRKFQFAEEPLAVYEGEVQVKLPLQSAANAAKGKRMLSLHLRIQACDEEKCFPPDTISATPFVDLK
ncbi:MAG TPA: protein-disulfide reductase DsbD domain-containing protein [Pyrinomonadaceae bacterium]|nr:protein-disulfide reductase DsbD domain-containing protein [Pyrinomonadaceae bacterium]